MSNKNGIKSRFKGVCVACVWLVVRRSGFCFVWFAGLGIGVLPEMRTAMSLYARCIGQGL